MSAFPSAHDVPSLMHSRPSAPDRSRGPANIPTRLTLWHRVCHGAAAIVLVLFCAGAARGQGASIEELFHQAQAASREKDYERAETLYRQVLAADPEMLAAQVNLGLACYQQHKSREALSARRLNFDDRQQLSGSQSTRPIALYLVVPSSVRGSARNCDHSARCLRLPKVPPDCPQSQN